MWEQVTATGIAALAAGALAVPATRRMLLGSVEQDWLARELEFDRIEADDATVRLKTGELFRVYRVQGISYDAKVDQVQQNLLKLRAAAVLALGDLGLGIRLFGVKRRRDLSFDASWPSSTLAEIGEAERQRFASSFVLDWFVVLSGKDLRKILEGEARVSAILGDYRLRVVARESEPAQDHPYLARKGVDLSRSLRIGRGLTKGSRRHWLPPLQRLRLVNHVPPLPSMI